MEKYFFRFKKLGYKKVIKIWQTFLYSAFCLFFVNAEHDSKNQSGLNPKNPPNISLLGLTNQQCSSPSALRYSFYHKIFDSVLLNNVRKDCCIRFFENLESRKEQLSFVGRDYLAYLKQEITTHFLTQKELQNVY